MIAVAFSGSRYADWRLANKGKIVAGFRSNGLNPNLHDDRYILQSLNKCNQLINHAEEIKKIFFFSAGASSTDRKEKLKKNFEQFFINAKIQIEEDIKGSALSALGDNKGIIGILGSGSNAGYYNGKKVTTDNYGLGFILADEGSSNWIGQKLIKSYLSETMPADIRKKFEEEHPLDRKTIMDKIYNHPNPTLFLTSFADFVQENKSNPFIQQLIGQGFELFIQTYIQPLRKENPGLPISFTGTIAETHAELLRSIARKNDFEIDKIIREPIHGLMNYYIKKT